MYLRGLAVLFVCVMAAAMATAQEGRPPPGVLAAKAQQKTIVDNIEALGSLRSNESVDLTVNVTEKISAILFDDNQRVQKGDVLIEMTRGEEKAQLSEARATVSEAKKQYERAQGLVEEGAATRSLLDERRREYQTAQARLNAVNSRLEDRLITAPFDGVLGLRNISVGALITPGTLITTLDDDRVMKLDFSLPTIYLSQIKEGVAVNATTRAYPDEKFEGTIASINSQINETTRAVRVRALVPNEKRLLKAGMLMNVKLEAQPRQAIVVPEKAIVSLGSNHYVFKVVEEEGGKKPVRTEVKLGTRYPGEVEIKEGLSAGEMIVVDGTMKVMGAAKVTITAMDDGEKPLEELVNGHEEEGHQ